MYTDTMIIIDENSLMVGCLWFKILICKCCMQFWERKQGPRSKDTAAYPLPKRVLRMKTDYISFLPPHCNGNSNRLP